MACHPGDDHTVACADRVDEEWLLRMRKQGASSDLVDTSVVKTVADSWVNFANNDSGLSYAVDVPGEICRALL